METTNFTYNSDHQLIMCIEHGYCIAPSSLQNHLNKVHGVKGERLRAALAEAGALQARDPRQARPPVHASAIPHLPIDPGFRCGLTACKQSRPFVSKSKRTIEKHLSKEHDIGHAKGKARPIAANIEEVHVQSFLARPHYLAFAVQVQAVEAGSPTPDAAPLEPSSRTQTPPHADIEMNEEMLGHATLRDLKAQYLTSQQQWHESHERFLPDEEQYVKQTPPWIRSTGIRDWLQGLGVEKKSIWDLVHAVHSSQNALGPSRPAGTMSNRSARRGIRRSHH